MSRYIATRAIRGANALVTEAELMLSKALADKGSDAPVAFPNTAYYLPVIYGMTGREVTQIGDLSYAVRHARELLHPVPSRQKWTPYLGETLDSGMATLLAAETIEAIRFVYDLQPEPFPGIELAGGTSYGSNGSGNIGHLNGPIDDIQLRSWGIQLVDGRMPGFAAIVGAARSNEVAVKIVRELQRRNILCFLSGNVNGRSIIHQLQEEGVELGYDTYTVPFGTDTISAIYALGFATRSALTFGGIKPGQARDILLYNKQRVFAFVLALGEVDDLKYAAAAGALNFGFPVIADTVIPEILPTGVTTYEHVVSMPFNEIEGKDDLERAEILVQKCIEVRGVKIKVTDVPVPVPYGSAFEGEVVRKADMRIEFGGKYTRCFEYLHMVDMDQVQDGKVEIVGPTFDDIEPQGHMDLGIVIEVAGRQMQKDFEPVLERQVHYFVNGASGIQHIGQRDIAWIRISNAAAEKGFSLEHFGKILHARYHADFGAIVDKVQVTLYTDKAEIEKWLARAREAYDYRNKRLEDLTDTAVDEFYSCTLCVPPDQDIMLADGSFLPIETLIHQAVDYGLRPVMTFAQDRLTSRSMGELFINPAPRELVCIRLKNGNDLTLTANHKVLVDRPEGLLWVAAGKLQAGDYVLDALPELEEAGGEPPYIIDYLPEDYKVADDAFYQQLRAWTLARYPRLTEAATAFGLPYRRLYSALYPRQEVSHQRLTIGEIKTALAALNQEWDAVKRTLRCFQSKAVLNRAQLDGDLLYVAGLVASDGCVRWRGPQGRSGVFVQFTNTEPALTRRFNDIVTQVFGHAPTQQTLAPKTSRSDDLVIEGRREVTVSVAANTLLGRLLNGLGIGLPGQEQKWNGYAISALSPDLVAAFLRGLFDGDGHVSGQRVLFTTRTKVEARHIHLLLKRLGIVSYISPIARGYQVATSSDGDALRFRERVGSDHPDKRAHLDAITLRQDEHHVVRNDTIPLSCHTHLAALVERYPIPATRLPVDGKTLLSWRKGETRPSKAKLATVLDALNGAVPPQDADYAALRAWTQADVRFQKVSEVVPVPSEGERVYNFSVEHTHNYLVNGVIVKNCQSFAPDHVCIVSPERLGLCGAYNWLDCKASFSINPTGPNQPIKLGQLLDPVRGYWQGTNEYAGIGSHGTVQKVSMYSIMENPMTACLTADAEVIIDGRLTTIREWVDAHHGQPGPFDSVATTLDDAGQITPSRVLGVHRNPAPPFLVELETKSGQPLTLTPNHPVAVDRPEGQVWVRADEVQVNDRVYAARHITVQEHTPLAIDLLPDGWRIADDTLIAEAWAKLEAVFGSKAAARRALPELPDVRSSWSLALYRKVCEGLGEDWAKIKTRIRRVAPPAGNSAQRLPEISPDLLYLLGFLASDGSLNRVGESQCQVFFTNTEPALLSHVQTVYERVFPDKSLGRREKTHSGRIGTRSITPTKTGMELYGSNALLGALADALGVRRADSPTWDLRRLFTLPETHIAAFIAGFFDGDGSVQVREQNGWIVGEAYLCHSDEQAARHMALLLRRLGIVAHFSAGPIYKLTMHGADLRRFASLIQSHHPARAAKLALLKAENAAELDKSQSEVLPYAAGQVLALADAAGTLSTSTRYYYASGRSRPVRGNVGRVLEAQPDMASTLQPWLERDDLLDTVTRAEMISNDGRYEYVYNLSLLDINSYLANGLLVKNCGCFECIVMLIPEANGVMVVSREDTSMTPAGMTFSTLAGMAGGGLQTPGVMGVGKYYLISPKFISADGGLKRVVWMSSILKETMAEELRVAAAREDAPELLDQIADERSVTDVDELVAWLEEHNHPALAMGPMEAGAAPEPEAVPASAISQAEAVLDTLDEVAPAVELEPEPALPEPAQAAVEPQAERELAMTPEPTKADLPPGVPGAPESPAGQPPPAPVPPAAMGDAGAAFFDQLRRALAVGLMAAARELGADVSGVSLPPAPAVAPTPPPAAPVPPAPPAEAVKVEAPAPPKKVLPPDKPWLSSDTKTEIVKEKWPGKVREITLGATKEEGGTRARTLTVGGESALPFMFFEGDIPHRPVVAIEILDRRPEEWSPVLLRAWGDAANDPAQWAKAAESAGADALVLALSLTDADGKPNTPERAVAVTKAVLQASGLPLIVWGPGQAEADNALLVPIAEETAGERLALGLCEDKNYRTIVATAMANNHLVIARTAMDVNLAKQLNILISDMGLPLDRVLMDPTTGALGYGIEYGYSVMERLRLAALQGDAMTQLPMIVTPGYEAWKAKESKVGSGVPGSWGDWEARAIHWETLTAMALVESAANIVVLRHPESVKRVHLAIDDLMSAK